MVTIKDIAQKSGYSLGTVSRVLNNRPDVSASAKEKILAVMAELDYQPNDNARHLKMQATSAVGIMVKGSQNRMFADLVEQIQSLLRAGGEENFIVYLDEDDNEVERALDTIRLRHPKGLIFLGGDLDNFTESFDAVQVPAVLLTNTAAGTSFENLSSFATDDALASDEVARCFIKNGHTRIGMVGGNPINGEDLAQISHLRIHGFSRRLIKEGLDFHAERDFEPCRFSMQEGYKATRKLLERNPDITAIYAICDVVAFGAIRAISDMGKKVPEDISVIGFDGIDTTEYFVPRLTTVRQNTRLLAIRGVEDLLRRINYTYTQAHELIPFTLVEGESVRKVKE